MPRKASASATPSPKVLPFIVSTSIEKEDADTRKLIRSHVMRGKNRRKPAGPPDQGRQASEKTPVKETKGKDKDDGEWTLVSPRQIASDLSLLGCGASLDSKTEELLYRGMTTLGPKNMGLLIDCMRFSNPLVEAFTIVKPAMYAATQVFSTISPTKGGKDMFCPSNLSLHPGMIHAMSFTAQAFHDTSVGDPLSSRARFHLAKTLRLLQRSLDDAKDAMSHSTMIIVASLASVSMMVGDLEAASKHLDGLYKLFQLRRCGSKSPHVHKCSEKDAWCILEKATCAEWDARCLIEQKARSTDVGVAIGLGQKTRFILPEELSWTCQIASGPSAWRYPELEKSAIKPHLNPWLLNVWADLREFSRAVNAATASPGGIVPREFIMNLTTSVPSRLVNLQYEVESVAEVCRLSMLAFVKTLLIKVKGLGQRLPYLTGRLKTALMAHDGVAQEKAGFFFWAMFIAALSVFEELEKEEWLRSRLITALSSLGLKDTTWSVIRYKLKEFPWVDMLHDKAGEELFGKLLGARVAT